MMEIFDFNSTHWWQQFTTFFEQNRMAIIITIGIAGAAIGGGVYYFYSSTHYEQAAQEALSDLLADVERAYQNPDLWAELEVGVKTALRQFKRSSAVPYFSMIQAEVLLNQKNVTGAIAMVDDVVHALSSSSPFFYLFSIKSAVLRLATDDPALHEQAITLLDSFINDDKNPQQDFATYTLAHYYQTTNQENKAHALWQKLAAISNDLSPVTPIAQYYLKQGI